jgi:hypothetical protein
MLTILVAGSVGQAATPKLKAKTTQGYVEAISMDGSLVAYDVKGALQGPACNRLFAWDVQPNGRTVKLSGAGTCAADETSTGAGVWQIAVAGDRVAWLVNTGGNTESTDELYTSSLAKPKEARVAEATRFGDVDCRLPGPRIGGLVGDVDLLAVNLWTDTAPDPRSCEEEVTQASLRTITGTSLTTIARGTAAWLARSAGLGRIAVQRADDTVALYSKSGRLLHELTPSSVSEVAMRKDYVVVLTTTKTLEVFSATTGRLRFRREVPAGAAHLDVYDGVAVYAVGRRVRAIELVTGKSATVVTAPRPVVGLALEGPGAVYAFNSLYTTRKGEVGNVVFVPFERLRAALSP